MSVTTLGTTISITGFIPANAPGLKGWRYPSEGCILFSFGIERNRKVKGPAQDQPGIKSQCLALTPAMIIFIALPSSEEKIDPG
jgi:hypothetical protein